MTDKQSGEGLAQLQLRGSVLCLHAGVVLCLGLGMRKPREASLYSTQSWKEHLRYFSLFFLQYVLQYKCAYMI